MRQFDGTTMMHSVDEEPFASLWQYWNKVRGDRLLPGSRELDFTQLAAILPEMSVLDIIAPDEMRYRMAGSGLVARFGGELTGANLLDLFSENSRPALSRFLTKIVTQPCTGLLHTSVGYQSGRQGAVQLLAVPIKTSDDLPGRIALVQRIDQSRGERIDEKLSVIGADFFSVSFIDVEAGKPDDLASRANQAETALTSR